MKPIINGTVIVTTDEARDKLVRAITPVAVTEITYRRMNGFTTVHVMDLPFDRERYLRTVLAEITPFTSYGTLTIYTNGALFGYKYINGAWYEVACTLDFTEIEKLKAL